MTRKTNIRYVLGAVLLSTFALQARGAEGEWAGFSVDGYGTLGVVHANTQEADFTSSILKPDGAGYSHNWSEAVDSRIGLQLKGKFGPSWSAVVQVITEQQYDDSYRPSVEWANIKYQASPDFWLRAGRIALPNFLDADYRKVGYAIPWVRTPVEIYNLVPITNSDGVDASYRMHWGEAMNTVQVVAGRTHIHYPYQGDNTATARNIRGFSDTVEYGALRVRMSVVQGRLTLGVAKPLFDAFRQFGPPGVAIAERYDGQDKLTTFSGIGANYDPGDWFVTGEAGRARTHSFLGDRTAWYLGGGYRIGNFTPYATLAQGKVDSNTSDPGLDVASYPLPQSFIAAALNGQLNNIISSFGAQTSFTVGLRWDISKNIALKVQEDMIRLKEGSRGNLINAQPGLPSGAHVNAFSATLDFVF